MLTIILNSFALVALSEMGDKTQLLAFSLAAKFKKPWTVLFGILAATLLNHALATSFGSWISDHLEPRILSGILAVTFIVFGFWTLKSEPLEKSRSSHFGPFLTTAFLFFIAEMGDKTQLATIALAAKYNSVVWVTLGTTLGMLATDGLAVFLGEKLTEKLQMKWIRLAAACWFFVFGLLSGYKAVFDL